MNFVNATVRAASCACGSRSSSYSIAFTGPDALTNEYANQYSRLTLEPSTTQQFTLELGKTAVRHRVRSATQRSPSFVGSIAPTTMLEFLIFPPLRCCMRLETKSARTTEIPDIIRAKCARPIEDTQQLWRQLVFNLLITNVDDHLQNLGFLYVGQGTWRLAPAFDVNPFPDKDRESKTWLSEDYGPVTSLIMLMERADYFCLQSAEALKSLSAVYAAVCDWRTVALSTDVGLLDNWMISRRPLSTRI